MRTTAAIDSLFAGRMIEGKGCILAAEAAIKLSEIDETATFRFVGSGPLENQVCKILEPLIKQNKCVVKPSLSQLELAEEFKKSTFFLFPSMREGESLGLVLVEAMACGSIPIAINQGALEEILNGYATELTTNKACYIDLVENSIKFDWKKRKIIRSHFLDSTKKYESKTVIDQLSKKLFGLVNEEL